MSSPRALRALATVGLCVVLSGSSCEYTVRETPPKLVSVAEDAVGSLMGANPPVLRVTVTQKGEPVVGADVRFIALDESGDELGNVGFADTDDQGVATVPLAGRSLVVDALLAADRYEVDITTSDFAPGGSATAQLRVTP